MFARSLTWSSLAAAALLAPPAAAQLAELRPFEGTVTDDFSDLAAGVHKRVRTDVGRFFTGNLHGLQVTDVFENIPCGSLPAVVGDQVLSTINHYCTMPDILRLSFHDPVRRFGASVLGSEATPSTFGFSFFDENDVLIGSTQVTLPASCDWHWVGFEVPAPAKMLRIGNPERRWVVLDYVTIDGVDEPAVGTSFCPSAANSTGAPTALSASGSPVVTENDLTLRAAPVPDTVGIFFYGDTQVSVPFGNGSRCVGGQTFRFPASHAVAGSLSRTLDLDSPPSPAGQIAAGATWSFQALYRDPAAGGARFNLSDGLEITFQ